MHHPDVSKPVFSALLVLFLLPLVEEKCVSRQNTHTCALIQRPLMLPWTVGGEQASYPECCASLSQNCPDSPHNRAYWFDMYPKQFHWSSAMCVSSLWEFLCNRRPADMSSVALPLKHCVSLQSNTLAGVRVCVCACARVSVQFGPLYSITKSWCFLTHSHCGCNYCAPCLNVGTTLKD